MSKSSEELILDILNSDNFDKEIFRKLRGYCFSYDEEGNVEDIAEVLRRQYTDIDIENIFVHHDKNEIIDFLNRLLYSKLVYKHRDKKQTEFVTLKELEEFKILAEENDKISVEELSKTAPILTTRSYMNMCRLVYDATAQWKYPDDISTAYLFCEARLFSFMHEYDHGILGLDWDSPEQFALRFEISYHNEELYFGGPSFYIHDESARIGKNCYTRPETYGQWTGDIYCNVFDLESCCTAIKMYIALRRKQYPVYFPNYKEAYSAALKVLEKCS